MEKIGSAVALLRACGFVVLLVGMAACRDSGGHLTAPSAIAPGPSPASVADLNADGSALSSSRLTALLARYLACSLRSAGCSSPTRTARRSLPTGADTVLPSGSHRSCVITSARACACNDASNLSGACTAPRVPAGEGVA